MNRKILSIFIVAFLLFASISFVSAVDGDTPQDDGDNDKIEELDEPINGTGDDSQDENATEEDSQEDTNETDENDTEEITEEIIPPEDNETVEELTSSTYSVPYPENNTTDSNTTVADNNAKPTMGGHNETANPILVLLTAMAIAGGISLRRK